MNKYERLYEASVKKREKIKKEINKVLKDENVQRYNELLEESKKLMNEQIPLYIKMKKEKYRECNHIFVVSKIKYDPSQCRQERSYGCIKCGLNSAVLDVKGKGISFEEQIMYDYLDEHQLKGKYTDYLCDIELAKAIYSKIKENHPDIDDVLAQKYFEIALDNIRNIDVSEKRMKSRAKRLSLGPYFDKWSSRHVITN